MKQRGELVSRIELSKNRLSSESFVNRAPADVVQQLRDKRAELAGQLASVEVALAKLSSKG